jgi:hypothetical protein
VAQHLVEQAHTFSTIHNTMKVLHYQKKSAHLNTVERYYIHAEFTANNHLNDNQNVFPNPIFDAILKTYHVTPHPRPDPPSGQASLHPQAHNTGYRRFDAITAQRRYVHKKTEC